MANFDGRYLQHWAHALQLCRQCMRGGFCSCHPSMSGGVSWAVGCGRHSTGMEDLLES